jgi:hypothetical protein
MASRFINLYFKKPFNGTIDVNNQTTLGSGASSLIFTVEVNDTNYIKMGNTRVVGSITLPSDLLTSPTNNKTNLLLFEVKNVILSTDTFSDCTNLQMVDLYDMGNIFIPNSCFKNCNSLNTVIFPLGGAGVKSIDISANAFAGTSRLTTLHFPSTHSSDVINTSAFDNIAGRRINIYDSTGTGGSARTNYTTGFPIAKGNIFYGTNVRTIYQNANYTKFYSGVYNGIDFSYNSNFIDPSNNNTRSVTSGNTSVITLDAATGNTNVNIINAGLTFIKANTFVTNFTSLWPSALSVVYIAKINTTVSGTTSYTKTYNDSTFSLNLTSAGGGAITYTSNNTNMFTVSGTIVTVVGVGSGTITGDVAETSNYNSSSQSISITVNQLTTTISGTTSYTKTYNDAPFTLDLTTNSGAPIVYTTTTSPTIFTLSGSTVTIVGLGSGTITGTITGTANYTTASQTINITVNKSIPIISVTTPSALSVALTDKINTYYQIAATNNNTDNSAITYSTDNPYIATVDQTGNVYILSTGTATITLSTTETNNFLAATPVNCTIYSSIKPSTSNIYTYKGTPINEYFMVDTTYPNDSSFNSAYNTEISSKSFYVIRRIVQYLNISFQTRAAERVLYIGANDSSYYSLNTGQSITIELYVNLESLYTNGYVCLIKKPKEYAVWANQTNIRCYNYKTSSFTTATTSANLNVGWKHIAFTYTNTDDLTNNATVYINGSSLFTCNLGKSTSALTSDDVFSIGDELENLPEATSFTLEFKRIFGVYGLRIWPNTIRTATEIASYYNVISPILGVDQYLLKEQTYTNDTNIFNSNTSSSISYLTIKEYQRNGDNINSFSESVWENDNPLGYINHFKKYDLVNTGTNFKQTDYFKDLNNTKYEAKYVEYTGNDGVQATWRFSNAAVAIADATDTSYNVTLPTGCNNIRAIVVGGGGGGGAQINNSGATCPGAGASGGAFYVDISNITATSITIKVGNGGAAAEGSANSIFQTASNGAASSIIIGTYEWKADKGGGGPMALSNNVPEVTAIGGNIYTPNSTSAINTTTNGTISNMNYTCIPYTGNATIQPPRSGASANTIAPTVSTNFPVGSANTENIYPFGIGGANTGSIGSGGAGGAVIRSADSNAQPNPLSQGGGGGIVRVYYMM